MRLTGSLTPTTESPDKSDDEDYAYEDADYDAGYSGVC